MLSQGKSPGQYQFRDNEDSLLEFLEQVPYWDVQRVQIKVDSSVVQFTLREIDGLDSPMDSTPRITYGLLLYLTTLSYQILNDKSTLALYSYDLEKSAIMITNDHTLVCEIPTVQRLVE